MSVKAKDNKAHASYHEGLTTSKGGKKRPSRQRAPFGENNGTVQKRSEDHKELHLRYFKDK